LESYFKQIKNDFDKLEKLTNFPTFYLEKETDLEKSIRYFYTAEDSEIYDDFVDVIEVDFIINVYFSNKIIETNTLISKKLRELEFKDIKHIGTEKEAKGYNTCFTFSKKYIRSE
jgi:hypothetical protein